MSLTAKKVDAIARMLLSETMADCQLAKQELERLMAETDNEPENGVIIRIHQLLANVGIPSDTNGHMYLVDAIGAVLEMPLLLKKATRQDGLYHMIGKKYGKSASVVEHGIRQTIEHAWRSGNMEYQSKYFPVVSSITMMPTTLCFISRAVNLIRFSMDQE